MSLLVWLVVWVLIFAVLCWIVSVIPLPAKPPFLRNVLYVVVGLFALMMLLNLVGWVDMGLPRARWR